MTTEQLMNMRETAKNEYESKRRTLLLMPMLQALFMKKFAIESQKAVEELTPEQRSELEKILGKK